MKATRLLFLVMAICLSSGVKAQFYDGPDDIIFYLSEKPNVYSTYEVLILNFDGKTAVWWYNSVSDVKKNLQINPNYYVDEEEGRDYSLIKYISTSSSEVTYEWAPGSKNHMIWKFSKDRSSLTSYNYINTTELHEIIRYRRVDKSFFKVGRSRTPSSTLHE